jgi:hypothetical protein
MNTLEKMKDLKKGDVFILSFFTDFVLEYKRVCICKNVEYLNRTDFLFSFVELEELYTSDEVFKMSKKYETGVFEITKEATANAFNDYVIVKKGNELEKYAHLLV